MGIQLKGWMMRIHMNGWIIIGGLYGCFNHVDSYEWKDEFEEFVQIILFPIFFFLWHLHRLFRGDAHLINN